MGTWKKHLLLQWCMVVCGNVCAHVLMNFENDSMRAAVHITPKETYVTSTWMHQFLSGFFLVQCISLCPHFCPFRAIWCQQLLFSKRTHVQWRKRISMCARAWEFPIPIAHTCNNFTVCAHVLLCKEISNARVRRLISTIMLRACLNFPICVHVL